ncbi:MAG: AAA family ATPase, partial [bacterium]|nr:AAA family ATPase [bacterium]
RKIDGFTPTVNIILIGATNRKKDLDPALLSRFDANINFPLPNEEERQIIFSGYAQHLSKEDLALIAKKTGELSGRDIKNVCERAERSWASKIIKKETESKLPPASHYLEIIQP